MSTNQYILFLLIGVVLIVADGQLIYRSGKRHVQNTEGGGSASMVRLVVVLFHLASFGVLALWSTVDFGNGNSLPAMVGKLGAFLLFLAVAHGVTTLLLPGAEIDSADLRPSAGDAGQRHRNATVTPVPGQPGSDPRVSPPLEQRDSYPPER